MQKNIVIKGDHNTVINYPCQRQLELESKEPFTVRLEPSIREQLEIRAKEKGIPARTLGALYIKRWMRAEPKMRELYGTMEDILD